MDRRTRRVAAAATAVVAGVAGVVATGGASVASETEHAKNVIYMVGDGMGITHVNAGRQRFYGADGALNMETMDVLGTTSTYAVKEGSDQPEYVTDSASSGTAWASGVKTYNAAIGKDSFGNVVPTVMEEAKAAGYRTGNVTTSEVTDATPAAMMAHVSLRGCQGPSTQMMSEECGFVPEELTDEEQAAVDAGEPVDPDRQPSAGETPIAQQVARNGTADVILGGGLQRFEPADAEALEAQGYTVLGSFGDPSLEPGAQTAETQEVATREDLEGVDDDKVVGLFNRGNLTVEQTKADDPDAVEADEPSLSEMTAKAIALLEDDDAEEGFLLQVEGALIDKRSHANDATQTLREIKEFDDAVKVALDYAEEAGDTLVVVTADHECAGFNIIGQGSFTNAQANVPPGNIDTGNPANTSRLPREQDANELDPARSPITSGSAETEDEASTFNAPGQEDPNSFAPATFRTPDDPEGVEDGSPEASLWLAYLSGNHTGADVPVFAQGPTAENFAGRNDNTDNYGFIKAGLGLE
ncbi:MAG: Alkaline phosphatase [uncultured Quadrisphaera sp.]|uniref:Alkaline phosphatase n=1 Tax=uncultured Quadrisphaera sp. TaxID=904978 RepID=A0A6J4PSW2_9ACTN|nr:MAG: Alkaline phosphatase [uncultured Quadrisphaera sp.]